MISCLAWDPQKYGTGCETRLSWPPTPQDLARLAGATAETSEMPVGAPRKRGRPSSKAAKCDKCRRNSRSCGPSCANWPGGGVPHDASTATPARAAEAASRAAEPSGSTGEHSAEQTGRRSARPSVQHKDVDEVVLRNRATGTRWRSIGGTLVSRRVKRRVRRRGVPSAARIALTQVPHAVRRLRRRARRRARARARRRARRRPKARRRPARSPRLRPSRTWSRSASPTPRRRPSCPAARRGRRSTGGSGS